MKLLTIHDVNDVRLDEVERGTPGPKDVVVKMKACGICGSDLSYIKMGGIPMPGTKTALGHEASGEVIEVGSDVSGHMVGQRVVINGMFVGSGGMEGAFTPELVLKDAESMGKLLGDGRWIGKIFNGQWVAAKGGTRAVVEPATGQTLSTVGFADAADIDHRPVRAEILEYPSETRDHGLFL